jgi:hypothetical protein
MNDDDLLTPAQRASCAGAVVCVLYLLYVVVAVALTGDAWAL